MWNRRGNLDLYGCCPTCSRHFVGDYDNGEIICPSCGFVAYEQAEDMGPEWKAIDPEQKEKRVRVGSPMTIALHDFGLTTEIGMPARDSEGRSLSLTARAHAYRLKMWQKRIRTSTSERSLSTMLAKITEVSQVLNLPKNVLETAAQIYRSSVKLKVAKSKSMAGMTSACVYLACRKCGVSRSIKEVAKAANIEKRSVARYYRLVLKEVEANYIPPPSMWKYIAKIVNLSKIDPKVERLALHLAKLTEDSKISSGKAPSGLAAAYVYIASVMLNEHIPQREIADVAEVTEVTVRNRCREILNSYVIRQKLHEGGMPRIM